MDIAIAMVKYSGDEDALKFYQLSMAHLEVLILVMYILLVISIPFYFPCYSILQFYQKFCYW